MSPRPDSFRQVALEEVQPGSPPIQSSALSSRWRGAMARSSLLRAVGRPWAGLASCLMYHRICPDQTVFDGQAPGFFPNRSLSVTVSAFDQQMAFVASNFNCLSLPEAIDQLAAGRLPPRSLVVTFDDGYLDNLTLALPILRRHAVPATIYVATGLMERDHLPWWTELEQLLAVADGFTLRWHRRHLHFPASNAAAKNKAFHTLNPMLKCMGAAEQAMFMDLLRQGSRRPAQQDDPFLSRQQLTELAADPLITIGAHSHHHLALSGLNPIRLRHEINRSRRLLEEWLQRPIQHLAYPFGGRAHASTREFSAAAELGFASAVTTRLGHFHGFHRHHLLSLPRIAIDYGDCMARFEWKLSGLYSLVRRPRSLLEC